MGHYALVVVSRMQVRLTLLTEGEGGRKHAIRFGYRCQWRSERKPDWNDGAVQFGGALKPGETVEAWLVPGVPRFWESMVPGDHLEAGEGARVIGRAVVLEVEHQREAPPSALLHFTASWASRICDPHREEVQRAAQQLGLEVLECDYDEDAEAVRLYAPPNVPAVALQGVPGSLIVGAVPSEDIVQRLRPFLDVTP